MPSKKRKEVSRARGFVQVAETRRLVLSSCRWRKVGVPRTVPVAHEALRKHGRKWGRFSAEVNRRLRDSGNSMSEEAMTTPGQAALLCAPDQRLF